MSTVLIAFADGVGPLGFLWRPLIISAGVGAILGVVGTRTAGVHWGTLLSSSVTLLVLWPAESRLVLVLLVVVAIAWTIGQRSGRAGIVIKATASGVRTVLGILLLVSAARAGLTAHAAVELPQVSSVPSGPSRNIYLLLLDAYGRPDTLRELGVQIDPFLARLRAMSFDIYEDATSRNSWTGATLAELFSGEPYNASADLQSAAGQREALRAIDDGPLIREAYRAGYELLVLDSPLTHVTFTAGHHFTHASVTGFEAALIARSVLAEAIGADLLMDQLRDRLKDDMEKLVEIAADGGKRIVLAHFMAPHQPFLYGSTGEELSGPSCWPSCDLFQTGSIDRGHQKYLDGLAGSVAAVNDEVARTVERIVTADPNGVIVVFGDHGTRLDDAKPEEWHRPFLAARTPSRPQLFAAEPDPGAVLRLLFKAYVRDGE